MMPPVRRKLYNRIHYTTMVPKCVEKHSKNGDSNTNESPFELLLNECAVFGEDETLEFGGGNSIG